MGDVAVTTITTTTPDTGLVPQAKVELAAAFRAAAFHGFNEGIDNHFSYAVPGREDLFLLNRYGPHWSEMRPSDLLTVNVDGELVEGDGEWETTAFMIHRAVHRARPDAHCVFHTHMPYATALSMTERGLETRGSQNSMYFHGKIARLPYGGLADADEEGDRIASAVADGVSVAMLDNHGVIVIGNTVADAWHKLYFLERACEVQVLAQSTGSPLRLAPEEVAEHTARQWNVASEAAATLFAAVRRQLDRAQP
jgi:ribulose-5-phosphate 4-epimerase/fuculose-1-phosphate aldolase